MMEQQTDQTPQWQHDNEEGVAREESQPRHEAEERAVQIRANLRQDMHTTLVTEGVDSKRWGVGVLDALVGDAMFQIEHLLVEIEALHIKDRARDERSVTDVSANAEVWHRD